MSRYMNYKCVYNIYFTLMASTARSAILKMRKRTNELIGDNLHADLAPMTERIKTRGSEIRQIPLSIIPDLWAKVEALLELNYK